MKKNLKFANSMKGYKIMQTNQTRDPKKVQSIIYSLVLGVMGILLASPILSYITQALNMSAIDTFLNIAILIIAIGIWIYANHKKIRLINNFIIFGVIIGIAISYI